MSNRNNDTSRQDQQQQENVAPTISIFDGIKCETIGDTFNLYIDRHRMMNKSSNGTRPPALFFFLVFSWLLCLLLYTILPFVLWLLPSTDSLELLLLRISQILFWNKPDDNLMEKKDLKLFIQRLTDLLDDIIPRIITSIVMTHFLVCFGYIIVHKLKIK